MKRNKLLKNKGYETAGEVRKSIPRSIPKLRKSDAGARAQRELKKVSDPQRRLLPARPVSL
jgi:hypothetical protein